MNRSKLQYVHRPDGTIKRERSLAEIQQIEQRQMKTQADDHKVTQYLKESDCRECGAENDRVNEYCIECEPDN